MSIKDKITTLKDIFVQAYKEHQKSNSAIFKSFVILVLLQFSFLSFLAITSVCPDQFPVLSNLFSSPHYWWGVCSLFGAACLFFEHYIKNCFPFVAIGYGAASISFLFLSYDYLFRRPPLHTGSILAVTATLFLGGLLYGRFRERK